MPRQPYSEPPVAAKVRLALHSTLTLAKLEALCDRTELDGTDKTVVAFELLGQLAHCCVRGGALKKLNARCLCTLLGGEVARGISQGNIRYLPRHVQAARRGAQQISTLCLFGK